MNAQKSNSLSWSITHEELNLLARRRQEDRAARTAPVQGLGSKAHLPCTTGPEAWALQPRQKQALPGESLGHLFPQ